MAAPAGPCEWCGGPQWWTVVHGEMWVICKRGCLELPGVGDLLPDLEQGSGEDEGLAKPRGQVVGSP